MPAQADPRARQHVGAASRLTSRHDPASHGSLRQSLTRRGRRRGAARWSPHLALVERRQHQQRLARHACASAGLATKVAPGQARAWMKAWSNRRLCCGRWAPSQLGQFLRVSRVATRRAIRRSVGARVGACSRSWICMFSRWFRALASKAGACIRNYRWDGRRPTVQRRMSADCRVPDHGPLGRWRRWTRIRAARIAPRGRFPPRRARG